MCGIAGLYDFADKGRADPGLVRRMCEALVHRGPDGEGFYRFPDASPRVAMGVRRLSIIDPEHGHQPLFNEDRSVALVFNGEIYNYLELRAELAKRGHAFGTGSDGETLVHLYEELGLDLFSSLRGMYAFALWDARLGRLLLAVDHVGIKPLYLAEHDGRLVFASEAKALFVDPDLPRRLDLAAVDTYLSFGSTIGPETLFEGVRRLEPGHALVIEGGTSRKTRHWTLRYPPRPDRHSDRRVIAREVRRRFMEAVHLHMRSDVPVGLFLSGGVDSAAILAGMAGTERRVVKTFTVGYRARNGAGDGAGNGRASELDETVHARRTAEHFGAVHHEYLLSAREWWASLGAYVRAHDEPNANPSMVALYSLAGVAAREVKVALNGTGGDELFAGYRAHVLHPRLLRMSAALLRIAPRAIGSQLVDGGWRRLERAYPAMRRRRYVGALPRYLSEWRTLCLPAEEALRRLASFDGWTFSDSLRDDLYSTELNEACARTQHKERAFGDILRGNLTEDPDDLVHALAIATWLPGNGLLSLDKVTMAHGLEARVPFFDPPLLAYAAALPGRVRARGNKGVLREALREDLPDFVLTRRKRPFETPLRSWLDGELADEISAVLLDRRCVGRGLLEAAAVERLVARHFRGEVDHTELVFRLLVLELWHREFLDR